MAYAITFIQSPSEDPDTPDINVFTVDLSRIGFREGDYYSHFIDIDPNIEYMLGIDQSTSSTGVALVSKDFSFVLVMTVVCEGKSGYDKERYMSALLESIESMLLGKQLIYTVVEEVPPVYGKSSHTAKVLRELKGLIEYRMNQMPAVQSLPKNMRFNVYPQQWKSTVFDKKMKGGNRFNQKAEIAKDIVKLFPALKAYYEVLGKTYGHDYDGFDAFGLVTHVRLKHFDPDWGTMNRSSKSQIGQFYVLFKYIKDGEEWDEFLCYFQAWSVGLDENNKPLDLVEARNWVDEESIYTNFIMAANTNKIVCTECPNIKMILAYLVESGEKYEQGKHLYVAVSKNKKELIRPAIIPNFEKNGFYCKKYYKE